MLDTLTTIILVMTVVSLCVWAWMRAARITDDEDEREAERLQMHLREVDWRWPR